MMTFNDFVHKNKLKNKRTSNIKIQQFLSSFFLNDEGIYLRDGPFFGDIGVVKIHPSKRTQWAVYINEHVLIF